MKRIFVFFIVALLINTCLCAQIQRKFFNFNLGISTKSEVINYFKSKGIKIEKEDIDGDTYIAKYVTFAGHNWPYTAYSFYKGKLYVVYFSDSDGFTPKRTLDLTWESMSEKLSDKYSLYYNPSSSNDKHKEYEDNRTRITLDYNYVEGRNLLSILYIDRKINYQIYEDSVDEL